MSTNLENGIIQAEIFTPLHVAIAENKKRRDDHELQRKVTEYLSGDVPSHFVTPEPVLYMNRHIATPSFETLRFLQIANVLSLPYVMSEDSQGIFVGKNELKRALGKLSVVKSITRNQDEVTENFTLFDFNTYQGKAFDTIVTSFNEPLIDFHHSLFYELKFNTDFIVDEADWVDRNHRDDLLELYKKLFSLLVVHGIMFEWFIPSEVEFINKIIVPAFGEVKEHFGCAPLICRLVSQREEFDRNWNAYPKELYQLISGKFNGGQQ